MKGCCLFSQNLEPCYEQCSNSTQTTVWLHCQCGKLLQFLDLFGSCSRILNSRNFFLNNPKFFSKTFSINSRKTHAVLCSCNSFNRKNWRVDVCSAIYKESLKLTKILDVDIDHWVVLMQTLKKGIKGHLQCACEELDWFCWWIWKIKRYHHWGTLKRNPRVQWMNEENVLL